MGGTGGLNRRTALASVAFLCLATLAVTPSRSASAAYGSVNGRIAFVSDRDGSADVYTMASDGGGVRRLTNDANHDLSPAGDPSGRYIAFRKRHRQGYEIYMMTTSGGSIRRLTRNAAHDGGPYWSPVEGALLFHSDRDGDSDLYQMDVATLETQSLLASSDHEAGPTTAADAGFLAFHARVDDNLDLYRIDGMGGSPPVRLTESPLRDFDADVSPDGSIIAFTRGWGPRARSG